MKKKAWEKKIKENCEQAKTYQPHFDTIIETLAEVLEQRDATYKRFKSEGAEHLVGYKSDRGSENLRINPLLTLWDNLNKTALAMWKELGLTPSGLKKIDESAMKKKKESTLAGALRNIGKA